jgi:Uma2 family endonuclease
MTPPLLLDDEIIRIPASANSLDGFREWAVSEGFPRRGRISYVGHDILIDMSPEELETHGKVKFEISRIVGNLVRQRNAGTFYPDRTLLTNRAAELSTEPDGTFVTWESLRERRVRRTPRAGQEGEYIELEGTPDWVLEVVSRSSVKKDTELLRLRYSLAGIPEYWLADARGAQLHFQILVLTADGYVASPSEGGWSRSPLFGSRFRLERSRDPLGDWQYTLQVAE